MINMTSDTKTVKVLHTLQYALLKIGLAWSSSPA